MKKQDFNDNKFLPSHYSNLDNSSNFDSKITRLVTEVHTVRALYFMAGCCQVILGTGVVLISVLGLVDPLWLSTVLSFFASLNVMVGLYLLYVSIYESDSQDGLLQDAIKRIMDSQN